MFHAVGTTFRLGQIMRNETLYMVAYPQTTRGSLAQQSGVLLKGGGHAMAAGFTLAIDQVEAFRAFLCERVAADLAGVVASAALSVDAALAPAGATGALVRTVDRIGPFGTGNSEPRFVFPAVRVVGAGVVGENHVRCALVGADGGRLKAIAFRALDGELGTALLKAGGSLLHVAGHLRADDFRGGDEVQLIVDDVAWASA